MSEPVAFVVMPFAEEYSAGLRDVIEPAVAAAGMRCVRGASRPLVWADLVDRVRLIVGHLAMERLGARNLPVSVLVRDDPATGLLYAYDAGVVESPASRSSPGGR